MRTHLYACGFLTLLLLAYTGLMCFFKSQGYGSFTDASWWYVCAPSWPIPVIWIGFLIAWYVNYRRQQKALTGSPGVVVENPIHHW